MQRERKPKHFLPKPVYRGGPKAMNKFIAENLVYPPKAVESKLEGTVVLRVQIDFKGNVAGSKIKSSLGHGCDEEAQRVVGLLKFDVDNKSRRGKLLFHKTINIHFHLKETQKSKTAEPVHQTQLNYTITKKQEKKPAASYKYTIRY